MSENETIYVFDTSAWLALIEDEPGAEIVQNLLERTVSDHVPCFFHELHGGILYYFAGT